MTLLLLFTGSGTPSAPTDPGGGGLGGPMKDDWFQRYKPDYKPTLRKQNT